MFILTWVIQMLKVLAFQVFGMFLSSLLGGQFFDAVKEAVKAAAMFDKPGAERRELVVANLKRAMEAGVLAGSQTADWAINLAIEYAVAQIKLRAPEAK